MERRNRPEAPSAIGRTSQVAPAALTCSAKASSARCQPMVVRSETSAMSGRPATGGSVGGGSPI